jgi:hypothetical protein
MSVEQTTRTLMRHAQRYGGPLVAAAGRDYSERSPQSTAAESNMTPEEALEHFDKELRLSQAAQAAGAQSVSHAVTPPAPLFRHGPEEYHG